MPKPNVIIKTDPQDPQPLEVMERAIVEISEGARKLLGSKLNRRAVLVLLQDATGHPMKTIGAVLEAAAELDKTYLRR